ncbi:MAG: hypothetical protein C0506_03730 [Anaerolinea sp.]|nr:hypothetical protein [Anaerolinea sp.]
MAIRRVRPSSEPASTESEPKLWPYPVLRKQLTVRNDGSVLVPASLVGMIGEPGEAVTVTFSSDGHIEIDGPNPRASPLSREGLVGSHTTAEFLDLLDSLPSET